MEQTKKSYDEFLARCRAANVYGDKPSTRVVPCPICPGLDTELRSEPTTEFTCGHAYAATHWYYFCDNCKEQFTTTESETITLASYVEVKQSDES